MKKKYDDIIKELSDKEIVFHLIATQLLLLTVAACLGWFLFDSMAEFFTLFKWQDKNIWLVGGVAGIAIVLLDLLLMKILPRSYYDDGGLNERLFRNKTIGQIALIAAAVAISEELLFRGVLQTHFGLIVSSLLFALIHYRYLFKWFLFVNIVALSFLIGYLYDLTGNLLVTIFMHFLINFLLGCVICFFTPKKHHEQEEIASE